MDRRNFITAAVGAVLAAASGTVESEPKLARVERFDPSTGTYRRVRMRELRVGDRFRIEHFANEWRAVKSPVEHPDSAEVCSINAEPWDGGEIRPTPEQEWPHAT